MGKGKEGAERRETQSTGPLVFRGKALGDSYW